MVSEAFAAVREMLASAPKADPAEPIAERRARLAASAGAAPLADGVTRSDLDVAGVPAAWLTPGGGGAGPVLLFLHGGGYRVGSIESHQGYGSHLAALLDARVLLIDYRLAPEHPFPAAAEDSLNAYRWLLEQGTAPERVAVIGDSAGGGLVGAVLLAAREEGLPLPAAGVCLSPWVDLTNSSESHRTRDEVDVMFSHGDAQVAAGWYLAGQDPRTPLASPLFGDWRDMPPMLVHAGDQEVLLDDAVRFAQVLGDAGVEVDHRIWPGMIHDFQIMYPNFPEAVEGTNAIVDFLRRTTAA